MQSFDPIRRLAVQLSRTPISRIPNPARTFSRSSLLRRDKGEQVIFDKLQARFGGKQLEVEDVSGGCGSFYTITISSPAFKGLNTIKQHRLVNECLKEEVKEIHGLQLKTIPEDS